MKRAILLILLIISVNITGQDMTNSEFWQKDKIQHSIGSFGISAATYTFLSVHKKYKHLPEIQKRLISFSTTMIIGSLKEVIDSTSSKHVASWEDMGANAIGGLAFQVAVTIPIQFKTKQHKKRF